MRLNWLVWICLLLAVELTAQTITTQPTNQVVIIGGNVTISVAVSGTGPFTCQWQFNGTNLLNNIITTVAGSQGYGFFGDGAAATSSRLNSPYGVAVDTSGNLFIADQMNMRIRKVDTNGVITTVAGNGALNNSGDGGAATNASLCFPQAVAVDAFGNLFIADTENNRIRKVDANGIITTVAGKGAAYRTGSFSGDGSQATNANLYFPAGIFVDTYSNLFIADSANNRIRKIGNNGIITTIAGNGFTETYVNGQWVYSYGDGGAATNANLNMPQGVVVDSVGNILIAEGHAIRKVGTNGIISKAFDVETPVALSVDTYENIFYADIMNNYVWENSTILAGNGLAFFSGDGGAATNASLQAPYGVAVDGAGNAFIADTYNNRIRKVVMQRPILTLNNVTTNDAGNYRIIIGGNSGSVTSSIVTLTVVSSPLISRTVLNSNASLALIFLTTPNASSRVLVATNLTPPVVWRPIYTNVAGASGAWQFTDTNISTSPIRFYRTSTP